MTTTESAPPPGRFFPTMRQVTAPGIRRDVLAGIAAGAVIIPQAMAYASIASLPTQVGLFTCVTPMIVYAALGGSRAMSVSTTSTIATLTATTLVSAGIAAGSSDAIGALVTLTAIVGLLLLLASALHLGPLVENISEATLVGIKVGLGLTVAASQIPKMLGAEVSTTGRGFVPVVESIVHAVQAIDLPTLVLSAATLVVLLALRKWIPAVPGPLVAVVGGIVLIAVGGSAIDSITRIPPVPVGLPSLRVPDLTVVGSVVPGAMAIAVMAFLETVSVARSIREVKDPVIDSDRELLAISVASLASAVSQTMPPAGGFSQSAVNLKAGARSQISTLTTATLALVVAFLLAPLLSLLPQATLACLVFVATSGLVDIGGMRRLARISPVEFWIAAATAVVGLLVGLISAVVVGVVLTLLLVLHELNQPRILVADTASVAADDERPAWIVVDLRTPLYTANVQTTQRAIAAAAEAAGWPRVVGLDVSQLRRVSVTVLDALRDLTVELAGHGSALHLIGLPAEPTAMAVKTRWWRRLDESGATHENVTSFHEALDRVAVD